MRHIHLRRPSPALALATAALLAALGGAAWASIPGPEGIIHGCYSKRNGQLRVIDTAKHAECGRKEAELNWEETGPPGPRGGGGPRGQEGKEGKEGKSGPPGVSDAYTVGAISPLPLSAEPKLIAQLSVPSGDYAVTASVRLTNRDPSGGATEEASCSLRNVSGAGGEASAAIPFVSAPARGTETVPLEGTAVGPAQLELSCTQLTSGATSASGAQIDAVQVTSVTEG